MQVDTTAQRWAVGRGCLVAVKDRAAVCIDEVAPALVGVGTDFDLPDQPQLCLGTRAPQIQLCLGAIVAQQLSRCSAEGDDALMLRQIGERLTYRSVTGGCWFDVGHIIGRWHVATVQRVESSGVQMAHQLRTPDGNAPVVVSEADMFIPPGIDSCR